MDLRPAKYGIYSFGSIQNHWYLKIPQIFIYVPHPHLGVYISGWWFQPL